MRCVDAEQCLAAPGQCQFEQYKFAKRYSCCAAADRRPRERAHNGRTVRFLRNVARTLCACLLVGLDIAPALADTPAPVPVEVAHGVYALMGQDGEIAPGNRGRIANIAFVVGPRGVVVVDSGVSFRHGDAIIAAVARVTRQPIRASRHHAPEPGGRLRRRGVPGPGHSGIDASQQRRIDGRPLRSVPAEPRRRARCAGDGRHPGRQAGSARDEDPIARSDRSTADVDGAARAGVRRALWRFDDPITRTLIGGSLVSIDSVPDMRDVERQGMAGGIGDARRDTLPPSRPRVREDRIVRGHRRARRLLHGARAAGTRTARRRRRPRGTGSSLRASRVCRVGPIRPRSMCRTRIALTSEWSGPPSRSELEFLAP